jgi:hypothetical protein
MASTYFGSPSGKGPRQISHPGFTVNPIPYNYAIPMLTGWELTYLISDYHFIRVRTEQIRYEKYPTALNGNRLGYWPYCARQQENDLSRFINSLLRKSGLVRQYKKLSFLSFSFNLIWYGS